MLWENPTVLPYARGGKMGEVVEVDEKGRILIPISMRNALGIEKGLKLVLDIRGREIVIARIDIQPAKDDPEELKGFLQNIPKTMNV